MRSVGKLKDRAGIQECQTERDSSGGMVSTWRDIGSMWVEMRAYSGFDKDAVKKYGGVSSFERVEFRTRWRDDLETAKNRLIYRGKVHAIISFAGSPEMGELIIVCSVGAKQ